MTSKTALQQFVNWQRCITTVDSVPGHSQIAGNETADDLTKQAARQSHIRPEPNPGFYMLNIRRIIHQWTAREHDRNWHDTKGCRQSTLLIPGVNERLSRFALKTLMEVVNRLTGHNALYCHLTLLRKKTDPSCHLTLLRKKTDPSCHLTLLRKKTDPSCQLTLLRKKTDQLCEE